MMSMETAAFVGMGIIALVAIVAPIFALWANRKPHNKHDKVAHSH